MPSFGQNTPKAQEQWREGVNQERTRRIAAGTTINGIPVQGREQDMTNLTGLFNVASLRQQSGDATPIQFRDRDNVLHDLTPTQMIDLYVGAIAWVESVYQASWLLKEGEVPRDYADDGYWP
jgi:hypothetical protein